MEKALSVEEMDLVKNYRQLSQKYKEVLQAALAAMLEDPKQE